MALPSACSHGISLMHQLLQIAGWKCQLLPPLQCRLASISLLTLLMLLTLLQRWRLGRKGWAWAHHHVLNGCIPMSSPLLHDGCTTCPSDSFPSRIGIPRLPAPQCPSLPTMPAGMPPALTCLNESMKVAKMKHIPWDLHKLGRVAPKRFHPRGSLHLV